MKTEALIKVVCQYFVQEHKKNWQPAVSSGGWPKCPYLRKVALDFQSCFWLNIQEN